MSGTKVGDTHVYRQTILDWPNDRVEAFITTLQDKRLSARRKIEDAEAKAKQIQNERERDRAMNALAKMVKLFAKIEKDLNKVTEYHNYIRMLCVQEGIDIYKQEATGESK